MARLDPQIAAHLEWIGFVRPTGLVVSAPALVKAEALLNRRDAEGQQLLRGCLEDRRRDAAESAPETEPRLPDFRRFASSVLGWNFSPAGYAGTDEAPIPAELEAVLPDGGEVLRPDFAVRTEPERRSAAGRPASEVREDAAAYGNADLVAHFFRRAFGLLRIDGTSGLIATNTIAQGDTRSTGLRWICNNGGEIYGARRRMKWPGLAAVVVSVLHVYKGDLPGVKLLDGEAVDTITAFLFHRGGHDDPARLEANAGQSFVGSYVLGMGFTFDDTDKKGVASPLAEMQKLIEADPRNHEVIFPYIGGEEVNTSPTHAHHRYVINFRDWPLRRADGQAHPPETWVPGSADILSARAGGPPWSTRRRPEIVPAGTMPASPEQPPLLGRATGSESRLTSPETGRGAMRTPANRDHDDRARDERGSGDGVPVETASWAGATDAERREWLRSGVVPVDYPGPVAADWPELLAIVEERVKPERMKVNRKVRRDRWWQFGDRQSALSSAIDGLERVLIISRVGQQAALTFLPPNMVFAETTIVFPFATYSAFCALQSRSHEIWARFFGSSMKDDLRYTPSDCFETFPFPDGWETHPSLEAAGRAYYEYRAALMIRNGEGLTKRYNRFHDPDESDPEIAHLRNLHAAMDRAVLDTCGWTDIPTDCEFLLDYEIDEEDPGTRKKPWRYRWSGEVRDEVLARLLELNSVRAAAERQFWRTAATKRSGVHVRRSRRRTGGGAPSRVPAPGTLWDDTP